MTERVRTESMSERALLDGGPCPRTLSQTILIAEILLRLEADLGLGPKAPLSHQHSGQLLGPLHFGS